MKICVVYFSRSGKTREIAKKLSSKLDTNVFEVTDDKNWKGIFGFIRGGFYASFDKDVKVSYDKKATEADVIITLSPLWAGGPSPAMRKFIRENKSKNIHLVLTNDGSDINKAFAKTKKIIPEISKMYGITKKLNNEAQVIDNVVGDMMLT